MFSSELADWLNSLRLDLHSPAALVQSLWAWLADAPTGVLVTAAAIAVALLALTRRSGAAALIVLGAIGLIGAITFSL
jgi:hypothetical protein